MALIQGKHDPAQDEASSTTSNLIYRALRERIIMLQMPPGSTMSEQETAASMGVSRTPVREAFIRLEREKMIIVSPQRRTTVARIDTGRIAQEQFIREALEQVALRKLINLYPTEDVIVRMENCIVQMENAQDSLQLRRWDDAFHVCVFEATGNQLAQQIVRRDCFDYQRIRSLSANDVETQKLNQQQHRIILDCIRTKDADKAADVLHEHLNRIFDELGGMKAKWPELFM